MWTAQHFDTCVAVARPSVGRPHPPDRLDGRSRFEIERSRSMNRYDAEISMGAVDLSSWTVSNLASLVRNQVNVKKSSDVLPRREVLTGTPHGSMAEKCRIRGIGHATTAFEGRSHENRTGTQRTRWTWSCAGRRRNETRRFLESLSANAVVRSNPRKRNYREI